MIRFLTILVCIIIADIFLVLFIAYIDLSFKPIVNTLFYNKDDYIVRSVILLYHVFSIWYLNKKYTMVQHKKKKL